jgi:hypothetical protein
MAQNNQTTIGGEMITFIINSSGHVEIFYPDGSTKEMPHPSRKAPTSLRQSIPRDGKPIMHYFLVKMLKLPDNQMTKRMVTALVRSGLTPDMLCMADLEQLSYYVGNFGTKSVEILERAIRSYK